LLVELQRYSSELAGRRFAVAITKCDTFPTDEVNLLTEQFLEDIGLPSNKILNKFKANKEYISYGFEEDFGVDLPQDAPLFVLPISSVSHLNTEALRYTLKNFVTSVTEQERED
ncbi:MAG: GTPase ObgE, partial [Sulfurovaceae bacterium]|nr:GTPase ObgE [Sulfurovaceae bacterium]